MATWQYYMIAMCLAGFLLGWIAGWIWDEWKDK
jgi:hypothetical protein